MTQCSYVSKEHKVDLELGHRVVCGLEEHDKNIPHDLVIRMIGDKELTELRKEHEKTRCPARTLSMNFSDVYRCKLQSTDEHLTHIYHYERKLTENEIDEIKKIIAPK